MDHQGLITSNHAWCYKCSICSELFTSSQGLEVHHRNHHWVRYPQLGNHNSSTPTVLCGQGHFYLPRQPVLQERRRQQGMVRMIRQPHQFPRGRMPSFPNQHVTHPAPRGRMPYRYNQPQQQVPYVAAPVTTCFVVRPDNRLVPYVNQMNLNDVPFAASPAESTHSSIGSTSSVTVTADLMHGNDQEVEELDLELRL